MKTQRLSLFLIIALFILSGVFVTNGFKNTANNEPGNKINLGLDLVGGSSLTLEADFSQYISDLNDVVADNLSREFNERKLDVFVNKEDKKVSFVLPTDSFEQFKNEKTIEKIVSRNGSYKVSYEKNRTVIVNLNDQYLKSLKSDAIQESIKNIQKRVDGLGSKEISIQQLGDDRILLQAPGFDNPENLKYAVGKTAKLTFHLIDDENKSMNVKILKDAHGNNYRVIRKVEVAGTNINNAYGGVNQRGESTVNFSLDAIGTEKFAKLTSANIGKRIAIVIDDEVMTAPSVREAINAGNVEISGSFDFETAKNLSSSLRAGALPIKLTIVEEKVVGATLGAILIHNGKSSLIISFIVVAIFMIAVYGALGLIASLAIVINLLIVMSILIITGGTLSLAGIAGLVLTVGMVVDSNVLIFERIKEELAKNDRAYVTAIRVGFDRAIATIIDSNVTTIIASVLLLWFGDSNIKGFALTLTYGVLVSFFSAVFFSKIIIQSFQTKILSYSFLLRKLKKN
jgi:preprotein translocase subunit SecD